MSDLLFPSLPGIVQVARIPLFVNQTQQADSGARVSVKKRTDPGYTYTLEVRGLRPGLNEPAQVFSFFETHAGTYESFLYVDAFDSATRRVRFTDDRLGGLKRLNGGVYRGEIELETTVPLVGGTGVPYVAPGPVFTKAAVPAASSVWAGRLVRVKDPGEDEELWICRLTATGGYAWLVVAY